MFKSSVERLRQSPWLYSIAATGSIVGAIGGGFSAIREAFQLPCPPLWLMYHVAYLISILFLAFLANEYRRRKTNSGALGKSFEYDKDGVLWHGTEKAIAFRVVTFLSFLEHISKAMPTSTAKEAFLKVGRIGGIDFAQQFGTQIYPAELRKGGLPFDQLTRPQRLALWSEYDSSTGWGLLSAHEKGTSVDIVVKHATLFRGDGGLCFAYMLAGYCETVLNAITSDLSSSYLFSGEIETQGKTITFALKLNK